MRKIQAYETADGSIFSSHTAALEHEMFLSLRDLCLANGMDAFTAKFILAHRNEIYKILYMEVPSADANH